MSLFVKKDVTPDPGDITLFSAKREVHTSYSLMNVIEQFLGILLHDFSRCYVLLTQGDTLNYTPKERKKVRGFPYNRHIGVIMRK
jgi:hypothetical protein